MSGGYIELYVSICKDQWSVVYDSITRANRAFESDSAACDYCTRLLVIMGTEPRFYNEYSRSCFKLWLNNQPNKHDLAELLNLQEMVS